MKNTASIVNQINKIFPKVNNNTEIQPLRSNLLPVLVYQLNRPWNWPKEDNKADRPTDDDGGLNRLLSASIACKERLENARDLYNGPA